MQLADVAAGNYIVRLQTYDALERGVKFYAQLNNGAAVELTYDKNMYGYVAQVEVGAATKSLTISTTNGDFISVDVYLNAVVSVDTELPMTEATTFNLNEAQYFYYTAKQTGYFTISANSTYANAEFGIILKTNPNDIVSTTVLNSGFPMYFVAGNTYYFDIAYTGIADAWDIPETINATFSLNYWQTPTIDINKMEYVPVTMNTDSKIVPVKIDGEVGATYCVGLSNVPFPVEWVYIHYAGEIIAVNGFSCFCGEITIKEGYDTIYFSTDWEYEFIAGVELCYVSTAYDDVIFLNQATEITLRAHETLLYYVYNLPEGAYEVTLTDNNGNVIVTDSFDNTVINRGVNKGFFTIDLYDFEDSRTAFLYFTNDSNTEITFYVTVTKGETIILGQAKDITLSAAENNKTYYVTGLYAGAYRVVITANPGTYVSVYLNGESFMGYGVYEGEFTIDIDEWLTTAVALTFTGVGMNANFSVLVEPVDIWDNSDIIKIDQTKKVSLSAENSARTYYIEGITKGLYKIQLNGISAHIQVIVGNQIVVYYGKTEGYFEYLSKTPSNLTVIVSYDGSSSLTFNLTVTKAPDDLLPLGVKRTVEMSNAESVKQFYLEGLSKGQYKITLTLSNGTKIEVLTLNGIIISYGETEGYFDVQTSVDRLNLIFVYNGTSQVTFTVLVTAVD